MRVDNRFSAIELFENRPEVRIAEPLVAIVRQHAYSVRFQRVETILDLLKTGIGIRPWQDRKAAEAPGMIGRKTCRVFIALSREMACQVGCAERNPGCRDGSNGSGHTRLIHVFERLLG